MNEIPMNDVARELLKDVADIDGKPEGVAFNIREDSQCAGRNSTDNIQIVSKEDGSGIDIIVQPGTKNDKVLSLPW